MAFDLKSIRKNDRISAPRVCVYGVEGIGKSTFASAAPSPVFIQTEDGLGSLNVEHFPLATKLSDVMTALATLFTETHEYQTVVLDSLDWLENFIVRDVESRYEAKDLAYGKGAILQAERWREVLEGLNALRNQKNMAVVLIAHTQIKRFDSPETEPYDRFQLKLQERSSALVREWVDALLFANYRTVVKSSDVGFNKSVARGISTGERLLFTAERPAFQAKNRYGMPDSIPLSWDAFVSSISK